MCTECCVHYDFYLLDTWRCNHAGVCLISVLQQKKSHRMVSSVYSALTSIFDRFASAHHSRFRIELHFSCQAQSFAMKIESNSFAHEEPMFNCLATDRQTQSQSLMISLWIRWNQSDVSQPEIGTLVDGKVIDCTMLYHIRNFDWVFESAATNELYSPPKGISTEIYDLFNAFRVALLRRIRCIMRVSLCIGYQLHQRSFSAIHLVQINHNSHVTMSDFIYLAIIHRDFKLLCLCVDCVVFCPFQWLRTSQRQWVYQYIVHGSGRQASHDSDESINRSLCSKIDH